MFEEKLLTVDFEKFLKIYTSIMFQRKQLKRVAKIEF